MHERQPSDDRDVHDQFSDDDSDGRAAFRQLPDFRRHAHCSQVATGSDVIERRAGSVGEKSAARPFQRVLHLDSSRDHQEPEVELTDCSSCSSADTPRERHTVLTHDADSAHKLDTITGNDDDDDDEIINVVDDLVT